MIILIFNLSIIFTHLIHSNNQIIKIPVLGTNKARNGSTNQLIISGWGVNDQNIVTFRCNAMGIFSTIFSYKEMMRNAKVKKMEEVIAWLADQIWPCIFF